MGKAVPQRRCKACEAAGRRLYREKNRERLAQKRREWNEANRDKLREYGRRYDAKRRGKTA
jgi:hypothetical protein